MSQGPKKNASEGRFSTKRQRGKSGQNYQSLIGASVSAHQSSYPSLKQQKSEAELLQEAQTNLAQLNQEKAGQKGSVMDKMNFLLEVHEGRRKFGNR